MTNMIQMCGNFHRARVLIINSRPDEITSEALSYFGEFRLKESRPIPVSGLWSRV